jgi:hypothetical protein
MDVHDVTFTCSQKFGLDYEFFRRGNPFYMMILDPKYTTLQQGIKDVMAGKIPAFAMSADFACAPAADTPFLEVLFRERRIGTIDENGNIEITVAEIKPSWHQVVKG